MTKSDHNKSSAPNPEYKPIPISKSGYSSFDDFYPFYLGEHHHTINRRLHLTGTLLSSLLLVRVLLSLAPTLFTPLALQTSPTSAVRGVALRLQPLSLSKPAWQYVVLGIGQGYFLAWLGHFFFERNKPATFTHPVWSFTGDLRMLWEVLTLKRKG